MYGKMQESGLTEIILSYASLLSGASILHFSPSEFLSAHHKERLQPGGCQITQVLFFPSALGLRNSHLKGQNR